MGIVKVNAKVSYNDKSVKIDFLVDSGATYTLIPENFWKKLELKSIDTLKFVLADGTIIKRKLSEAVMEYSGIRRTVQVILGEKNDEALLGVLTLESLGLVLNPFKRELKPMKLMLA